MPDSKSMIAERAVQHGFTLSTLFGCLLLLVALDIFLRWLDSLPDRRELGPRVSQLVLDPVRLAARDDSPFTVAGAWEVASDDPRVGGVSGLALDGDRFIALTDDGAIIRFGKPRGPRQPAFIRELPAGPRSPRFKKNRDSEAIVRDPAGRGWWVSFETVGEVWLYDAAFSRSLMRVRLGRHLRAINTGAEGAAAEGEDLLLFSERGGIVTRYRGDRAAIEPIIDWTHRVSEAATLPSGRIVVVERWLTPFGFRNALVVLEKTRDGYRRARSFALPSSPLDNVEALAVEPRGDMLRLWLMTDDSFEQPFRTLLVALEVEPARLAL